MANEIYGYIDDDSMESSGSTLVFGLNAGVTHMVKFEYNANAGKDGTAQDALDVVFNVDGKDISYRIFPVTKAFDKSGNEVTDPTHPSFKQALRDFNSTIVHILHAFVEKEVIKQALGVPVANFKEFCIRAASVLPPNYKTVDLDIFAQYQWQISGDNTRTYLRFPKNLKHGKWLCAAVQPVGEWKETRPGGGLAYKDDSGNEHPFKRKKWFMTSNFAAMQEEEPETDISDIPDIGSAPVNEANSTVQWD